MSDAAAQTGARPGFVVREHFVPAPTTVSPHAQAILSQRMDTGVRHPIGADDKDAWRAYIAESDRWLLAAVVAAAEASPATITAHQLEHTPIYEMVPESLSAEFDDGVILYIHGGAYLNGSGEAGAYMGLPLAGHARMRAFAVDYRMPPDHPFPVGLDDSVDAYRWLLERYAPEKIAVCGGSAGGGLAAALVLKVRDIGLPMPGAVVLTTPEADLTESGDSFETNIHVDVVATERLTDSIALYADGHDLRDPYLSPLFGDFGRGFPPTILTCGTRDLFLSNTVLLHRALRRAGVDAELHVWEAMPHGGFFGAPEDQELLAEQARFLHERLFPAETERKVTQ